MWVEKLNRAFAFFIDIKALLYLEIQGLVKTLTDLWKFSIFSFRPATLEWLA